MPGRMLSPRVTYWTGTWDPAKEAISKEVNALRTGPRDPLRLSPFSLPAQGNQWRRRERV